ncbi:hypothetical protein HYV91_00175 [Candidatus Wolfebacteria bacterium]|nr:hypothetical protein [Candidatus Wolfebacteria bacterium]
MDSVGTVAVLLMMLVMIVMGGLFLLGLRKDLRSLQGGIETLLAGQPVIGQSLVAITESVRSLVESQRLSSVLSLSPASLKIDPAIFKANKEQLRTRLLRVLSEEKRDSIPAPTWAYCVLEHSGWGKFVDGKTFLAAQAALTRLLANGDLEGAKALLGELVDKL